MGKDARLIFPGQIHGDCALVDGLAVGSQVQNPTVVVLRVDGRSRSGFGDAQLMRTSIAVEPEQLLLYRYPFAFGTQYERWCGACGALAFGCLLYTSDAADDTASV